MFMVLPIAAAAQLELDFRFVLLQLPRFGESLKVCNTMHHVCSRRVVLVRRAIAACIAA